ncbi:hypothetical protein [Nonomuraea sp. bgisy101]|uniref:hypothetical protein n=1 Tax=Nonomuraea sp. bgisy101 TaxID=3413784 RepID=UPI003D75B2A5
MVRIASRLSRGFALARQGLSSSCRVRLSLISHHSSSSMTGPAIAAGSVTRNPLGISTLSA